MLVRSEVSGRNASGLYRAQIALAEHDYMKKFTRVKRGVKAAGLRFENKIQSELEAKYTDFIHGIPFRFSTSYSRFNVCIPDGLLLWGDEIVVIEIKLRHTADAWFQLTKLYKPVVQMALHRPVRRLEICKNYMTEVQIPEPQKLFSSMPDFLKSRSDFGCVVIGR